MKDRAGFALIAVLWVTAALGVLTTLGITNVEVYRVASENRVLERRARWAARACVAVLRAEYSGSGQFVPIESYDVDRNTRCSAEWHDPQLRLNPNVVDSVGIHRITGSEVATASILDWIDRDDVPRRAGAEEDWYRGQGLTGPRNAPFVSVREMRLVRGLRGTSEEALARAFTMDGDGRVDANRAPAEVLRSLSMFTAQQAERIALLRDQRPLDDPEEVMNAAGARLSADAYRELTRRLVFDADTHTALITGQAFGGGRSVSIHLTVDLESDDGQLRVHGAKVEP